jgi:tight adherence protein B
MSRRTARVESLLLAGFLFGSLVLAFPAAAQQQEEGLEVALKGVEAPVGSGELTTTLAMSGTAWGAGQELDQRDFSASFNGKKAEVIEATPLGQSSGRKLAVVLAIDTSGSMLPDNIERAKAAADAFATRMEPGTRMGVVAFSDQPVVVQELTSDLGQVRAAIGGLTAQGDTALYDAVIQSSQLLGKEDAQRNLVLLSDGLHDGPPTTIKQAIDAANKNEVDIYTVGLGPGGDENSANLERMAKATGGKAFSAAPEQLERLYAVLATTLASQYVVRVALPPGLAGTVSFRLQVRANGATGRYAKPDLFLGQGVSPPAVPAGPVAAPALSRLEGEQGRYVLAIAGFATILLACLLLFGPGSRTGRPYRALRQRLSPYSLTPAISDDQPRLTAFGSSEWAGRATAMAETLVRRGNLEETFLDRLEAAGLNMRVAEFVLISLGSAFIPPLLVLAVTQNFILAVVVVLLGTVAPFMYLSFRASRRQAKFDEQLPSTLQLLAGALQAGHSLQQAVDTVVHEAGDPIAGEFQRVLTEARLGRPLEEAFEAMAKRTGSVDFEWTVMAIRLQRQVGGNLAEVLSTVSQTIRDRYSLKRQIKALSAEGRLSSLILSLLPFLLFGALLAFNPLFLRPLYTTSIGIMLMAGAALLMILGVLWLRKITEIKV